MGLGELTGATLSLWRRNLPRLLLLGAVVIVPADLAVSFFDPSVGVVANVAWYGAANVLLYAVAVPWAASAMVAQLAGRAVSVGAAYAAIEARLHSLVGATLLYNACLLVGAVLFVAPAVFVGARWSLYVPAVLLERRGAMAALARSNELVRGRTWTVLGAAILAALVWLAIVVTAAALSLWETFPAAAVSGVVTDLAATTLYAAFAFVLYERLLGSRA